MKQTLMNKIIMPAVLVGSLALGSGCLRFGGITPEGKYFGQGLLFNVIDRELGINQYERHDIQTQNSYAGLNSEEIALLKIPRVVNVGDFDGDGKSDWVYYDGKGNRSRALEYFDNEEGIHSLKKQGDYVKRVFLISGKLKNTIRVLEKVLVIE